MPTTTDDAPRTVVAHDEAWAPIEVQWSPETLALYESLRDEHEFHNRIRMARLDLGLSQIEASRLTGEDQGDISKMESGRLNPSVRRVQRYVSALQAAVADGRVAPLTSKPLIRVTDAARYLLAIQEPDDLMTPLKIQKLLYYAQGFPTVRTLLDNTCVSMPKGLSG